MCDSRTYGFIFITEWKARVIILQCGVEIWANMYVKCLKHENYYVSAGKSLSHVTLCTALFTVLRWHYKVIMGFGLLLNSTGYIIRTINT